MQIIITMNNQLKKKVDIKYDQQLKNIYKV